METEHLVGYWPLRGDCRDASGHGHHGLNHGVDLAKSLFDGRDSYIAVAPSESLRFDGGSLTVSAWIDTARDVQGVIGDIVSKYDSQTRKGFSLCVKSTAGGYSSQGDDRHLYFGIDEGRVGGWEPCGRPSPHSNYVSNSLTVYDGELYAGTTDAKRAEDWCHVFRYVGGQEWADCGRVGNLRTHGVGPMIVHAGKLHAATWNYDWTRVAREDVDLCHVYSYAGGKAWVDCGQPGENRRLIGMASYKGQLYVSGDDSTGGAFKIHVHEGGTRWRVCAVIPMPSPQELFPHAMGVYAGKLYVGTGSIHCYDGEGITYVGTPAGCTQVHSLEVHEGRLYAGAWPEGKVFRYQGGEQWEDCGRLGDSIEVNALVVHNGKLYAGSIPRAEVYRYEGGSAWTRMARFFSPEGWRPVSVEEQTPEGAREWTRVTSLTVSRGRLFASIGSCTGSILDAPCDVRGQVFSMEAGGSVSDDRDLGFGAKHVVATRAGGRLALYVNGELAASSLSAGCADCQVSNDEPLKIGLGGVGHFSGRIWDLRAYDTALSAEEVRALHKATRATNEA